jgi:hypothetical protein
MMWQQLERQSLLLVSLEIRKRMLITSHTVHIWHIAKYSVPHFATSFVSSRKQLERVPFQKLLICLFLEEVGRGRIPKTYGKKLGKGQMSPCFQNLEVFSGCSCGVLYWLKQLH